MKKCLFISALFPCIVVQSQVLPEVSEENSTMAMAIPGNPGPVYMPRVIFEYDEAGNQIYRGPCPYCKDANESISASKSLSPLSEQVANKIQAAPVPVKTDLTVIWDLSIKDYITKIELLPYNSFNILQSVHIKSNSNNSYVFPMSTYNYGVYYLKFYLTDGSIYTRSITKN
ncbi:hypothetical protein HNP38_003618 [Chryseobacterium defluvii]|uniref:Secreted protein (Por secretion system target) n=1 Tax=Chryseobacterium defluvii TaxID=160396 RepID=A0A840KGI4_9FLAO|nr:hypothetical protein [Chryseobacterium defluvii]MBB4808276.1 hypothetical protein [Chryseobacterium defluvii]